MAEHVVFIGTFRVRHRAEWEVAVTRMRDFVRTNVPGIRSFHAYADVDAGEATVMYVHPDGHSFDQHLGAAAEEIRAGTQMVDVIAIQVLGPANAATVERLRAAGLPVSAKAHVVGFDR